MTDELARITHERRNGRLVVALAGEVDLSNAEDVQARIELLAEPEVPIVVDLSEIEYIDSQGLRLLSRLARALAARGVDLELVAPRNSIARDVLDLTQMQNEIAIRDALDPA